MCRSLFSYSHVGSYNLLPKHPSAHRFRSHRGKCSTICCTRACDCEQFTRNTLAKGVLFCNSLLFFSLKPVFDRKNQMRRCFFCLWICSAECHVSHIVRVLLLFLVLFVLVVHCGFSRILFGADSVFVVVLQSIRFVLESFARGYESCCSSVH